jgi:hypothetical protein
MFYERFLTLCKENMIAPSTAATEAGFNRGTVSVWKKKYEDGMDVQPENAIIKKICRYFHCSEAWLLGIEEEQQKKPTPENRSERNYNDLELIEAVMHATEDQKEAIRLFLKMR